MNLQSLITACRLPACRRRGVRRRRREEGSPPSRASIGSNKGEHRLCFGGQASPQAFRICC